MIHAFLVFLVFGVYANSLFNGFVSDDIQGIVQAGPTWTLGSVFTDTFFLTRWTRILHFFIYQLVGLSPWAYRLVNITCHAVSVLLVYKIVFQLVNQSKPHRLPISKPLHFYASYPLFIAFLVSALFAVHPIIIESVTWIAGGVYTQYGMFFLLSFWLYIMGRGRRTEDGGRKFDRFFPFSAFCLPLSYIIYCICLLFSEKAGVLFLLFFLYEFCFGNLKKNWRKLMPYFIVSCIFILFYMTQLNSRIAGVTQVSGAGGSMYNPLIQLPVALSSYFYLIFWPKNLTLYHQEVPIVGTADYVFRVLTVCVYIFGVAFTAVKNRKLCFWLVWFIIPLIPTITPLKISWLVAERYAYLSVIGIFVLIAYGFEWVIHHFCFLESAARVFPRPTSSPRSNSRSFWKSFDHIKTFMPFFQWSSGTSRDSGRSTGVPRHALQTLTKTFLCISIWVFILCIYLSLIMRTVVRNQDWQSEDALWIATSKTSPSIPFTWNNMGDVYSRHKDYKKAAEMFQRAISLSPNSADYYHNLGETYRDMGEIGDAILMYEKALALNPNLWQSHGALAGIYYNKKDYQTALLHIEEALKIVPDNRMLLQAREQLRKMQ